MIEAAEPVRPGLRMRSNVRWNVFGNVAYALGSWVQLIILARMGGPAAVGAYAFALALTAPVMMFASLSLRFLQASDARRAYAFREYLTLRGATSIAGVLAVVIIAWKTGAGRAGWPVLLPICAMRAVDALADIYYGIWHQQERMNVIAWGLMLNAASSAAFMIAASKLGAGVAGASVGAALGSCVALLFVQFRTATDPVVRGVAMSGARPLAWRRVGRLATEAAPLGVILLLGSLQVNVPRFFVERYAGEAALGLFAAASQLTTAGDIVAAALGAAATPRLASLRAGGEAAAFGALTRKLVFAGALLGASGIVFSALAGRWFLVTLYRPEFGSGARVLVVLSVAAGMTFLASLLGYALTSARVIAIQPVLLTVTLVVLVVCCAALVPRHGEIGAAWALIASSSVHALVSWVALRRFRMDARRIVESHETRAA